MKNLSYVFILTLGFSTSLALAQDQSYSQIMREKNKLSGFSAIEQKDTFQNQLCLAAETKLIQLDQTEFQYNADFSYQNNRKACLIRFESDSTTTNIRYFSVQPSVNRTYHSVLTPLSKFFFVHYNLSTQKVVGTVLHTSLNDE